MITLNFPFNFISPEEILALGVLYLGLFLGVLGNLLTRRDLDPIVRLTWVVVLVFVPVAGVVFYFFFPTDPRTASKKAKRSDSLAATDPANQLRGTPWENDPGHTNG